jgi:hypothetical protein
MEDLARIVLEFLCVQDTWICIQAMVCPVSEVVLDVVLDDAVTDVLEVEPCCR